MKKGTESVEMLHEKSSTSPSITFENKSKVFPIWVWIALAFAVLLFVAGLVCIIVAETSGSSSCKLPVAQGPDVCSFSEEANRVNLPQFLKKVQTEYYALNPNSVAWQPDIVDPDEHMKQRYQLDLIYSLENNTYNQFNQDPITNTKLPGYHYVSQPTYSNAGGVGFYIKEDLEFTLRDDLTISKNEFEALWIEIQSDSQHNMICGILYRHPGGNVEVFQEYLNSAIEKIHRENKYCMIMGVFNLDLLKFESHPATDDFMNILGTSFFHPHILQPTRITDHSATLIDNIFLNSLEHFTISGNIIYDLTDHLPNFLIINKFSTLSTNVKIYKRDFSKLNESAMINEVQSVDWNELLSLNTSNPSALFDLFYGTLSSIVDKHIPIKQLSKRELNFQSKPCYISSSTKEINT